MKRRTKKIAQLIIVSASALFLASACSSGDDELLDSMEIQAEQATDEEDEKKQKPG